MQIQKKSGYNTRQSVLRATAILAGSFLFALAVSLFYVKSNIPTGGLTGIAMILHFFYDLPVGGIVLCCNFPILYMGLRTFGWRFILKTVCATILSSLFIDLFPSILPDFLHVLHTEPMLAAIYGGVLSGGGLGLVFFSGATTGGVDVLSRIINRKYPHISLGRVMLYADILVIGAYGLVLQNINMSLYGMVSMFVSARIIDAILYGPDNAKFALIISDQCVAIGKMIDNSLGRGVTYLDGEGGKARSPKKMLFTAIKQNQIGALKAIVSNIDTGAFVIVLTAQEVLGSGFKRHLPKGDENIKD